MAAGAVRELVTKIKFITDGAGLETAKTKIRELKDRMNKVANQKIKLNVDTSKLEEAQKRFEKLGQKFTSGGMMLAGAGAGLLGAVGLPVKTAADFEATMSKVRAITGSTDAEMQKLTATARQLGRDTIFSASEAGEAMTYLGMAGWKTEQIIAGMPGLLDLAAASGGDLARTADIISDDLTAFGMSADQAGHMADVFAAASMNANTNVELMGYTFKYVGAVCGALGYSIEDAALATGLLANAGIKGEMAGTQLRAVISSMAKPSSEAAKAMDDLHLTLINVEDGSMKPLRQILNDLRQSFSGLTKDQQAEKAATIAGREAMTGLLSIVNASQADFDKLANSIDNSNGAAHNFAETSKKNLKGSLKELNSAVEELSIELGNTLLPDLDKITKKVREATNAFSKFAKEHPRLVGGIMAIAGALGALFVGLGTVGIFAGGLMQLGAVLLPVLTPILAALSGIGAIAAGPVVLAFAAVGAMIAFIADNWETFYHWIEPGLGMIQEGVSLLAEAFNEVFTAIQPILPPLWEIVKIIGGILVATLSVLFNVVAWVFKAFAGHIKNIADLFVMLQGPIQTVADMLSGLIDKAKTFLGLSKDFGAVDSSMRDAEHGGGGQSFAVNQDNTIVVNSTEEAVATANEFADGGLEFAAGT